MPPSHQLNEKTPFRLYESPEATDDSIDITPSTNDDLFDVRTTVSLVVGQSVLVGIAALFAYFLGTPQLGLGTGFMANLMAWKWGVALALPLGGLAVALDSVEDRFPALKDVSKATQRSVMLLLGGTFKPVVGMLAAIALGIAAGVGEEMLFRGVFQYELVGRMGTTGALLLSSVVFGLLHAVTPLYAFLATLASLYFGGLYVYFDNLAIPMICHAVYDIGALYFAHWEVSKLSPDEQEEIAYWQGPGTKSS